jgi:hypothetical protein
MGIITSEAERAVGLIYLEPDLQKAPATHALVIGVGQYATGISERRPEVFVGESAGSKSSKSWSRCR